MSVCVKPIGTPHSDVIKRVTASIAVGLALCSGERGLHYLGQGDGSTSKAGVLGTCEGCWKA